MEITGDQAANVIELSESARSSRGRLILRGKGAIVRIGSVHNAGDFVIDAGTSSRIILSDRIWINALKIRCDEGASVEVGAWCGFNGTSDISAMEGRRIVIGAGSLFADKVQLLTSDSHSIFDLDSQRRINPAGDIVLGPRVWLGTEVKVMKNVTLGGGCVAAACAVITKSFPSHCLIGGIPAKILRRRVTWHGQLTDTMPEAAAEITDHTP